MNEYESVFSFFLSVHSMCMCRGGLSVCGFWGERLWRDLGGCGEMG